MPESLYEHADSTKSTLCVHYKAEGENIVEKKKN